MPLGFFSESAWQKRKEPLQMLRILQMARDRNLELHPLAVRSLIQNERRAVELRRNPKAAANRTRVHRAQAKRTRAVARERICHRRSRRSDDRYVATRNRNEAHQEAYQGDRNNRYSA